MTTSVAASRLTDISNSPARTSEAKKPIAGHNMWKCTGLHVLYMRVCVTISTEIWRKNTVGPREFDQNQSNVQENTRKSLRLVISCDATWFNPLQQILVYAPSDELKHSVPTSLRASHPRPAPGLCDEHDASHLNFRGRAKHVVFVLLDDEENGNPVFYHLQLQRQFHLKQLRAPSLEIWQAN